MKNETDNPFSIPRHGYITKLAKMCNCSRKTVTRALFHGYTGPKANKVIEAYKKHFQGKMKY
ncbi:MAG: hypothetical protein ACOX7E_08910 [Paludibacter sp.]|jgi:hypothetical protein